MLVLTKIYLLFSDNIFLIVGKSGGSWLTALFASCDTIGGPGGVLLLLDGRFTLGGGGSVTLGGDTGLGALELRVGYRCVFDSTVDLA